MINTDRFANEEVRRTQVAEFSDSGMTAKAWCAQSGVSPSTLYYWKRKLAADNIQYSRWVDIAQVTGQDIAQSSSTAIIPMANGTASVRIGAFTIEVDRTTDTEALRKALAVAASLC